LQACKGYQPEEYKSFTTNTKVQKLFMFRKKLGDIKGLFLRALGMKSLSCTENTELAQAISAKSSELKDYTHQK